MPCQAQSIFVDGKGVGSRTTDTLDVCESHFVYMVIIVAVFSVKYVLGLKNLMSINKLKQLGIAHKL